MYIQRNRTDNEHDKKDNWKREQQIESTQKSGMSLLYSFILGQHLKYKYNTFIFVNLNLIQITLIFRQWTALILIELLDQYSNSLLSYLPSRRILNTICFCFHKY